MKKLTRLCFTMPAQKRNEIELNGTSKNLEKLVTGYIVPTTAMVSAGLMDSYQTYMNIKSHGNDWMLEGNGLIRSLIELTNLEVGLFLPKLVAAGVVLGVSANVQESWKGKLLMYGASAYWITGFLLNNYYY